ncbi:hypothetical protein AMTRI_Chr03g52850 [Amborella trichopoda]
MAFELPECEVFWSMCNKADRKFAKSANLPLYGKINHASSFKKVFKIYTKLWKYQQDHRQKLIEDGVKRWEIGEIASRIAQIYFTQYMRTSEMNLLCESCRFYQAILEREYFKENSASDLSVANKQLRCYGRFLTACLTLGKREMVHQVVNHMKSLLDEHKRNFQDFSYNDWKRMLIDINRFLKADTAFMNRRPLRYSVVLDADPYALPSVSSIEGKRALRLSDAILGSYHHNEVKFAELNLDLFRMLQCLEWEPSGSFYPKRLVESSESSCGEAGAAVPKRFSYIEGLVDHSLPPNPRKAILYRPAATQFISVLAAIWEDLAPDGILLIYLSAAGKATSSSSGLPLSSTEQNPGDMQAHDSVSDGNSISPESSSRDSPTESRNLHEENHHNGSRGCLRLSSRGNEGLNNLYPNDIIPFTRRPLFLIVDCDSSHAFKAISGAEMGETVALLLSPTLPSPCAADADSTSQPNNGSQFTMFLTAPLQAFCLLVGVPGFNLGMDAFNKVDEMLSSSFDEWGKMLADSESLDPVWAHVLTDPFLRRLILRFIFCRGAISLYAPTSNKKEYLPECLPPLPESFLPASAAVRHAIFRISWSLDVADNFHCTGDNPDGIGSDKLLCAV